MLQDIVLAAMLGTVDSHYKHGQYKHHPQYKHQGFGPHSIVFCASQLCISKLVILYGGQCKHGKRILVQKCAYNASLLYIKTDALQFKLDG